MAGVLALPGVAQATNAYLRRLRRERLIDQAVRNINRCPKAWMLEYMERPSMAWFVDAIRAEFARLAAEAYR